MNIATRLHRLSALLAGLALAACGSGGSGGGLAPIVNPCSISSQNQSVYQTMQQWYLWYQEMPVVNPASFASPGALLEALRFQPLDRFSYITTVAEEEALFGASQFIGLGFRVQIGTSSVFAADVYEGAPADLGGLMRGSEIVAVNGVPIATVLASPGGFSGSLGPAEVGFEIELTFQNPGEGERTETFTKDVVTIPPVTGLRLFELDGEQAAYLVLRNFVEPSVAALDEAFDQLSDAGVTRLVVDLRYNGGGLTVVMEHFADLLGSRIAPDAPFVRYLFNDKNTAQNSTSHFRQPPLDSALALQRLAFITTAATASASEMLINGLQTYVPTAVIGGTTFGKPVGQFGFSFCGMILRPATFRVVNGVGEGDFFDGIPPTCEAPDDLAFGFGADGEGSFDTAVFWLQHSFCPQAPVSLQALESLRMEPEPAPRPRWRINDAH